MANELEKRFEHYLNVEVANDAALKALISVRNAYEQGNAALCMEEYGRLIGYIRDMGKDFRGISKKLGHIYFGSAFIKVESTAGAQLEDALRQMQLGKKPELSLERVIDGLNYHENYGMERFDMCCTMHDFVRCLHCSSLEALFSGGGEGEVEEHDYGENKFKILRKDKKSGQEFIDSILHIYKQGVEKKGVELGSVVVLDKGLFMRLRMGCHLSYLDIKTREDRANIRVRFGNTSPKVYQNANNRAEYVKKVLEAMKYREIEQEGDIISGRMADVEKDKLHGILKETMRFLASTKDLDVNSCNINGKVDKAVKAFLKGKTNIFLYLHNLMMKE